jgi:hypothetical protein
MPKLERLKLLCRSGDAPNKLTRGQHGVRATESTRVALCSRLMRLAIAWHTMTVESDR